MEHGDVGGEAGGVEGGAVEEVGGVDGVGIRREVRGYGGTEEGEPR